MKKWENGVYLIDGRKIVKKDISASQELGQFSEAEIADAHKYTISYNIIKEHNVSDDMSKLQIKFDSLVGQDMTYMGVLETAIASGAKGFPIPFVLSSCHNALCMNVCRMWQNDFRGRQPYALRSPRDSGNGRGRR